MLNGLYSKERFTMVKMVKNVENGHNSVITPHFRDTRDNQEHDAKNRLLIPVPSSENRSVKR